MLQNGYLLAKIGADTAENERKFAENLPKIGNYPMGSLPAAGVLPASLVPESGPPAPLAASDSAFLATASAYVFSKVFF